MYFTENHSSLEKYTVFLYFILYIIIILIIFYQISNKNQIALTILVLVLNTHKYEGKYNLR